MADNKEKIVVGGFAFSSEEEAKQAKQEIEGVKFIKEKMDKDDPVAVLQLYNKMIRQNLFETVIGYSYLKDLQEYLWSVPSVNNEEILPIPIKHWVSADQMKRSRPAPKKPKQTKERYINIDYKNRYRIMRGIAVVLAICIVAMFAISMTSNTPTILNYEQTLINRYAQWEQELNEREGQIREKEAELGIKDE